MNDCSDLRKCPASFYHVCPAYEAESACWDTPGVPCCRRNDKSRCPRCTLYLANLVGVRGQIYPETVRMNKDGAA